MEQEATPEEALVDAELETLAKAFAFLLPAEMLERIKEDAVGFFSAAGRLASESAWVQSRAYRDAETTLHEVVNSLPERDRRIVTMRYFEDRGLEDIAKELSVSYISARRYHHAALQRLGARLAARSVDAGSLGGA